MSEQFYEEWDMYYNWCAFSVALYEGLSAKKALKECGLLAEEVDEKRQAWIEEDIQDIITCREKGIGWNEIGEKYGVAGCTACNALRRWRDKHGSQ